MWISFNDRLNWQQLLVLISIIGVILIGHQQAQLMVKQQPMKMAAAEALWDSEDPASLSLLTISNEETGESSVDIRIPNALVVPCL